MKAQATAGGRRFTKVVITRSREGNLELGAELRARGFEPLTVETVAFLPPEDWSSIDESLRCLHEFDWLCFTSATGAEFFARRMAELSLDLPWRGRPAVAAVGEKTAESLRARGVQVSFVPSRYLTKVLAEELPKDRGSLVLVLRADLGDPEFVPSLARAGFEVKDHAIYRTTPAEKLEEPGLAGAEAIVFASPSAVEAFMSRLGPAEKEHALGALAFCIGPVTSHAARRLGFERIVSPQVHTIEGVLETLETAAAREGS